MCVCVCFLWHLCPLKARLLQVEGERDEAHRELDKLLSSFSARRAQLQEQVEQEHLHSQQLWKENEELVARLTAAQEEIDSRSEICLFFIFYGTHAATEHKCQCLFIYISFVCHVALECFVGIAGMLKRQLVFSCQQILPVILCGACCQFQLWKCKNSVITSH